MMNEDGTWPDQPEMVYHMPYLEDVAAKCSVIIEIGCGHGNGSTRAFERGLMRTIHPQGARLFLSVDDNPDNPDVKPTISCWHKVTGDSRGEEVTAGFLAANAKQRGATGYWLVDLIYIDTDHTYEQLAAELERWVTFAYHGTIWLFHDTFMFGTYNHMTDAIIDFCAANPEWEYVELTKESHGLGMMRWKNG